MADKIEIVTDGKCENPQGVMVIQLGAFKDIDIQTGFRYNTQIFRVNYSDVRYFLKSHPNKSELIVKVFDPVKCNRRNGDEKDDLTRDQLFYKCKHAYNTEFAAYEILSDDERFNNLFLHQKKVFAQFYIGKYYHALGPFITFRYIELDLNLSKRSEDERIEMYKLAKYQLSLIHEKNIVHGDILRRNVLYSSHENKIYLIDFGNSIIKSKIYPGDVKREHMLLCDIFGVEYPTKEEWKSIVEESSEEEEDDDDDDDDNDD